VRPKFHGSLRRLEGQRDTANAAVRPARYDVPFSSAKEAVRGQGTAVAELGEAEGYPAPDGLAWSITAFAAGKKALNVIAAPVAGHVRSVQIQRG
jgi:hypothetical protein